MSEKIQNVDLKVVGVTFTNDDGSTRQSVLKTIFDHEQAGETTQISLVREPTNPFDKNAIKVITQYGQVGYIAKDYAAILADMFDTQGRIFTATLKDCDIYKGKYFMAIIINED